MAPHHPLRIPAGWNVVQNNFIEISPSEVISDDGQLDYPFVEDILQLQNNHLRMTLDLGWYPDSDPAGQFRLVLIQWDVPPQHEAMPKKSLTVERRGVNYTYVLQPLHVGDAWSNPLIEITSRDQYEIASRINETLALVFHGKIGTP